MATRAPSTAKKTTPATQSTTKKAPAKRAPRAAKRAPRTPQIAPVQEIPTYGPTESAVRADLERMALPPDLPTQALAQMAFHLARKLDNDAGLATAAVARELRATLTSLTVPKESDDGDPLADLLAALSSPVVDAPN